MIRFGKKAIAIALVAMMTIAAFAGCGKKEAAKLDEKAVFMTVGDTKVSLYHLGLIDAKYEKN